MRKSAPWLKTAFVTAAWAAVRVKGSHLHAQFLRLKARRGAKNAILVVAASMLTAAYHMLKNGVEYQDPGAFRRFLRPSLAGRGGAARGAPCAAKVDRCGASDKPTGAHP